MRKFFPFILLMIFFLTACSGQKALSPSIINNSIQNTNVTTSDFLLSPIVSKNILPDSNDFLYQAVGVGGGGAMGGVSFSPVSSLWFVGTDMGTLFRSVDKGAQWTGVFHSQTTFSNKIDSNVSLGFSANPNIILHAPGGIDPVISKDTGRHWNKINFPLMENEKIVYFKAHSYDENYIFAGTNKNLWMSKNGGDSFSPLAFNDVSKGTYLDYKKDGLIIYHATSTAIFKSENYGANFVPFLILKDKSIRAFTGGRDAKGLTLSFLDDDGYRACSFIDRYMNENNANEIMDHKSHCGFVWTGTESAEFTVTSQFGGDFLLMAENNSSIIYTVGSEHWILGMGTQVYKSENRGQNFSLVLEQLHIENDQYTPWPTSKIEYSPVAMAVGWWDTGYKSFSINTRNAQELGGSGLFFFFASTDGGATWKAPFTQYADTGERTRSRKFASTGLEPTTVYRFKFHPQNALIGYAGVADIGAIATFDGGKTFRMARTDYNSTYDFAFDPNDQNIIWAAVGSIHDYPYEWHANSIVAEGGIFESRDQGLNWKRLTPVDENFNRQFLSVAFDAKNRILYGGTQGGGVARSLDSGLHWEFINEGLPAASKIIPQIECDPDFGTAYLLLSGDAPTFSNHNETGIYVFDNDQNQWSLLRKNLVRGDDISTQYTLWNYPTSFQVDFSKGSSRNTLWLVDYENNGNYLATGIWKSSDRGDNWARVKQYTHPTSIILDPIHPERVFVSGLWDFDWGEGGAIYSYDAGETWSKNDKIPYLKTGRSTTLDPSDPTKIFYTFAGDGIMHGPLPQ